MPNGGIMPGCSRCKHGGAQKLLMPLPTPVTCNLHKILIHNATDTFCSELTPHQFVLDTRATDVSNFVEENKSKLEPDTIYVWLVTYSNGYVHEFVRLTTVADYAAWSHDKEREVIRSLNAEFANKMKCLDA
jgi:hypothetical protein